MKLSMRSFFFIGALLFVVACNKDDDADKYSSVNGYWVVTTPDDATNVTFWIGQDADGLLVVDRVAVRHNGVVYNSENSDARITLVSAREVESITIISQSFVAPFYVIRFQDIQVNDSFTEMQINIASINVDGEFREFSSIVATRD